MGTNLKRMRVVQAMRLIQHKDRSRLKTPQGRRRSESAKGKTQLTDVIEQRQFLNLGVGLQRRLVSRLLFLEVGDGLDHVHVLGA